LVAGDPEWRAARKRSADGIPLAKGVWEQLAKTASLAGVTPPPVEDVTLE
jgi:LDH2 family malate/lactate/ureidoglycolate dehydrogenase